MRLRKTRNIIFEYFLNTERAIFDIRLLVLQIKYYLSLLIPEAISHLVSIGKKAWLQGWNGYRIAR